MSWIIKTLLLHNRYKIFDIFKLKTIKNGQKQLLTHDFRYHSSTMKTFFRYRGYRCIKCSLDIFVYKKTKSIEFFKLDSCEAMMMEKVLQ